MGRPAAEVRGVCADRAARRRIRLQSAPFRGDRAATRGERRRLRAFDAVGGAWALVRAWSGGRLVGSRPSLERWAARGVSSEPGAVGGSWGLVRAWSGGRLVGSRPSLERWA